jgi:hypothetical protein
MYWKFIPEVGIQFANLLANEKLARVAEKISQKLLTNSKPGNTDQIHAASSLLRQPCFALTKRNKDIFF